MTITLNVPEQTEKRLLEEAERQGVPVSEYVLEIVNQRLNAQDQWLQILDSGHFSSGTSLSDQQMRRESIYDDEH